MKDKKSANDVLRSALFSSFIAGLDALKENSAGTPNILMKNLAGIHANTSFDDMPKEVRDALNNSVRDTLSRLRNDGYTVAETGIITPNRNFGPNRHPSRTR